MGRSQEGGDLTLEFHPGGIFWGISHPEFPAPRSRLSREKRFGKGSKFGICAAASSLENIPKPRGLFWGGDKREKLRHATGWEFPNSPKSRRFGMRDSHSRPWRCRWLLPVRIAATSGPPRGHLGVTAVPAMGWEWDGIGAFPPHSRPIPAEFPDDAPRPLKLGTATTPDGAGDRWRQPARVSPQTPALSPARIQGFGVFLEFLGSLLSLFSPSIPIQGFQGFPGVFGVPLSLSRDFRDPKSALG